MESVGAALVILAIILYIIALIWWLISQVWTSGLAVLVALATFFLIVGVVTGAWSLMARGIYLNQKKLPGLAGINVPLATS